MCAVRFSLSTWTPRNTQNTCRRRDSAARLGRRLEKCAEARSRVQMDKQPKYSDCCIHRIGGTEQHAPQMHEPNTIAGMSALDGCAVGLFDLSNIEAASPSAT